MCAERVIPQESVCSELLLSELASHIVNWERLAPRFGLTDSEMEEIRQDNIRNYRSQKVAFLRKWKQKLGLRATIDRLVDSLRTLEHADAADKVLELATSSHSEANIAVLQFKAHLKACYKRKLPPCATSWPRSRTVNFIKPILILKEEFGCSEEKTIKLEAVFTTGCSPVQRQVILIEAPAGSGKSTLVWYVNQRWACGEIFQNFDLLIHVSLCEQTVQSANHLQDILPHPSEEIRNTVSNHIERTGGKGIAFVMDGWDELFSDLDPVSSYIFDLVFGNTSKCLPHATIIVMSRPVCHSDLHSAISSKVAIAGFSQTQAEKYLSNCLSQKFTQADLDSYLTKNPLVLDLCSLPINASIIAFILRNSFSHIPETCTSLFELLIKNLLLRHFKRTKQPVTRIPGNFNDLPDKLREKFTNLCNVAFIGVTEEDSTFDSEHFEEHDVYIEEEADTFGLMQTGSAISPTGESVQYSFLHQAIQGYLAAFHMSEQDNEQQCVATEMLLRKNASNIVLPFFSGISKLKNRAIFELLLRTTLDPSVYLSSGLPDHIERRFDTTVSQRLLLLLLNCIYESESSDLCSDAADAIVADSTSGTITLTFYSTLLGPTDYIAIGNFLAHLSNHSISLSLSWCSIRDSDLGLLFRGLIGRMQDEFGAHQLQLELRFEGNDITHVGTQTLLFLIKSSAFVVKMLNLESNWAHPQTNTLLALKYLSEALAMNLSLRSLNLSSCGMTTMHTLHLFLMLTICCTGLQELDLSYNSFGDAGGCLLAIALGCSYCSLKSINLECCDISNDVLLVMGKSLNINQKLEKLNISHNPFSHTAMITFFKQLEKRSCLQYLVHSIAMTAKHRHIVQQINNVRVLRNIPKLFTD